ncbi:fungal hydrophobin-domain-containing protein [Bisporella sp. PMI_857]|nr:fungal hydrophobin-domain-containing protein [Bisporella sp. PMI_857]
MRTSFIISAFAATAFAVPAKWAGQSLNQRQAGLCASGTPQCCDVDVLGVADLNCETPPTVPTSITDFNDICASVGKIDMCCLIPILEQGLICTSPSGS